jgi:hypothetical protein
MALDRQRSELASRIESALTRRADLELQHPHLRNLGVMLDSA